MSYPAIRSVLAAYRSTDAVITKDQITAAWGEYERACALQRAVETHRDAVREEYRAETPIAADAALWSAVLREDNPDLTDAP